MQERRFQFSLRTLFVVTTIVAVTAWIIRVVGPTSIPPVLLALWWLSRRLLSREAGPRTGIRWKRVFFCALASLAICIAARSIILSHLPTGGADFYPYDPEFVEILHGSLSAVASGMAVSFLATIIGVMGWSFAGH
jgi:hypothetical protein